MNADNLERMIQAALDKIKTDPPPCFMCRERLANRPVLLAADRIELGAPLNGSRAVVVGICVVCEMLSSDEDIRQAGENLLESGANV